MTHDTTRSELTEMFMAGVAAADPVGAVQAALATRPVGVPEGGTLILLAIGKAANGMMEAARAAVPKGVATRCLIVTNYENHRDIAGVACYGAGHPVPDGNGVIAGLAVEKLLHEAGPQDVVLALVSGGGSALLPGPVKGLALAEKAEVNRLLLASGADIEETNIIRQALSRFKGGGLLRLAAPAHVRSLILSDVVGDDLRVIASGPTVGPIADLATARNVARRLGIWDRMPEAARVAMERQEAQDPLPRPDAELIGSNALSVAAMAAAAARPVRVIDDPLTGLVTDAAARILDIAADTPHGTALLFGGETTVILNGDGRGGRNQELALRVALLAEERGLSGGWLFLSGGTDGRDGPTDAAGGIVDAGSLTRMRAAGADPRAHLANSDSYAALAASGDLLMTGATGTNVADLQIFVVN
ncbi:glycerate kinase type-2 family protein [Nioella aestuarii]|uniref:glycerate kinase type-2 family protein n=1 Tax=Nioella aestuarii TaxID=1662864 RepID=UPI003D7FB798